MMAHVVGCFINRGVNLPIWNFGSFLSGFVNTIQKTARSFSSSSSLWRRLVRVHSNRFIFLKRPAKKTFHRLAHVG